eukprot:TRINITY_DN13109_c0_g1_i2.p1 TRINITY_DN13109_c0_g1~~TRINITY_DN13109_c0_g1_i2.p1  ORF type:complete len:315 (+),score=17.04 TRINITY_DN13109_c0_g1_i2:67-945(+)
MANLPDDVWYDIFAFASGEDALNLRCVCKQFLRVLNESHDLWGRFLIKARLVDLNDPILGQRSTLMRTFIDMHNQSKISDDKFNARLFPPGGSCRDCVTAFVCPCYMISDTYTKILQPERNGRPALLDCLCACPNLQPYVSFHIRRTFEHDAPCFSWFSSLFSCIFCFPCSVLQNHREVSMRGRAGRPITQLRKPLDSARFINSCMPICGLSCAALLCLPCYAAFAMHDQTASAGFCCACAPNVVYWGRQRVRAKYGLWEGASKLCDAVVSCFCMPCVAAQNAVQILNSERP